MKELALAQINIAGTQNNIFQRRDGKAPTSPHRLAWFGGHIDREIDKDTLGAIVRELGEETSLDVATKVIFGERTVHVVPPEHSSSKELVKVYLFRTTIQAVDANFKVLEGSGSEQLTNEELLQRNDVASTVRFILEHMDESQTG
jgi:8-oxo-dGTP pyrophosphatase MutT (NUDIX family)